MTAESRYSRRGVSFSKEDVHAAIKKIDKGLYPKAFCKIIPDALSGSPDHCIIMHADGAGTKSSLAYTYWKETGDMSVWDSIWKFVVQMLVGGAVGYGIGRAAVFTINNINIKNNASLYSVLLLAFVFFSFSFTSLVWGNGYLAVYVTGLVVGNLKLAHRGNLSTFFDGFTWLAQIVMFLSLGLLVNPLEIVDVALVALCIGLFMMFVARPLSVFASLLPFNNISISSKVFTSWVGLRGAVPIIFAMYPVVEKVPGSEQIFDIVFFITLLSLIMQGSTIGSVAKKLNLTLPPVQEKQFDLDLPDEVGELSEMTITAEVLADKGSTLKDFKMPRGLLVLFIKRNDRFIVPNGSFELREGDHMLIVAGSDFEG